MIEDGTPMPWHLKKEITVGQILLILAVAGSMFTWVSSMETRIAVLETRQDGIDTQFQRIVDTLIRIEEKIDNKADK